MFDEEDLQPIAALQHLAFCERQWGLMYLEGVWAENVLTAEGRVLHDRVHGSDSDLRDGIRTARSLRLRSLKFGLTGMADVVEFHPFESSEAATGVHLPGRHGLYRPFPVEYKRGKPKPGPWDEVQLCAQALCLEEMLEVNVPAGAIFYGMPRRRLEVNFNDDLRSLTRDAARRLHELTRTRQTPPARYDKRCRSCSLYDACLPQSAGRGKSARRYLQQVWAPDRPDESFDNEEPV